MYIDNSSERKVSENKKEKGNITNITNNEKVIFCFSQNCI